MGATLGLGTSVSLCSMEGRLERGHSGDWEEAVVSGSAQGRFDTWWGHRAAWLVWVPAECCRVLVLSLCVMHSDVLVWCWSSVRWLTSNRRITETRGELQPSWRIRMYVLVSELKVFCQVFTNVRDFHVIFESIIYQHTRELKRYSSTCKNK